MTETPPDWVTNVPSTQAIHNMPAGGFQPTGLTQDQLQVTRDKFNEMILQIVTMSTRGSFVPTGNIGDAESQLYDWANGVENDASTALFNTETQQGFFNTPRVLPAWIGALSDDVAFARDGVDGTTAPPLGTLVLIPVTVTQDRVIDAIKIGCAATTMTNLYIGLYDCNETTGDLTKVIDLGDRKADLNMAFSQQTFELVEPVGVQTGELYFISVLQVGGTAAAMHRKSLSTNFTNGLFPKFMGSTWATTGISAMPTTILDADVLSGNRFWGALGTSTPAVTPGTVAYSDSFNRADDSSNLGPNWTNRSNVIGISGNQPRGGFFVNESYATYNGRLSSTSQLAGFRKPDTNQGIASMTLRGNGLGPHVELQINLLPSIPSRWARIQTRTGYNMSETPITRSTATYASDSQLTGDWTFEAIGTVYKGYLNGIQQVAWNDSGGAFTVASNSTEVGLICNASNNVIDNWFAQDV